jgi:hypothetical protein
MKFITCRGDELGLCNKCKVRFYCYTGELPAEFTNNVSKADNDFSSIVELNVFGAIKSIMDYDYLTHNHYYKQNWHVENDKWVN